MDDNGGGGGNGNSSSISSSDSSGGCSSYGVIVSSIVHGVSVLLTTVHYRIQRFQFVMNYFIIGIN